MTFSVLDTVLSDKFDNGDCSEDVSSVKKSVFEEMKTLTVLSANGRCRLVGRGPALFLIGRWLEAAS